MPGFNGYTSLLTLASFQCKYKRKSEVRICFEKSIRQFVVFAKKKVEFLEKNPLGYVTAAFLAGMFVGLVCVLMGVVGGYFNAAGSPATKLLNGLIFAVGLNFCVYGRCGTVYRKQFYNECKASIKGEVSWGKRSKCGSSAIWEICSVLL